jgi:hypothetical protein
MKPNTAYPSLFGLAFHPLTVESAFGAALEPRVFPKDPDFGDDYFV